ncbi:MAG: pseudouridine synthase [Candidatus Zixiibacteriota bacterium]
MIRLSKYLSMAGVTSRRGAEALVAEGRVTINDETVEKIGTIVDESADVVKVDGSVVAPVEDKVYVVLNKPRRVMTTLHDPFKRRTVRHLLEKLPHRVYPVGRLDYDTEGVLVLCNDGELAFRLAHPRYQVPKTYEAIVLGRFTKADSLQIQQGVRLDDGAIGRAQVHILGYGKRTSRIRLTLTEGRKREVKQLCKAVRRPVRRLRRVDFAGITAKGLRPGAWRHLTPAEVMKLKGLVGLE